MPETLKTLLAKRELLMNKADSLRKSDPRMADYLDKLGNDMDGELEGTEPIQERDENGYLQGEDPEYQASHEARARVEGRIPPEFDSQLSVSPTYRVAVNKALGDQMSLDWLRQYQTPRGAPIYNNSVTPDATTLKEIEETRKKKQETMDRLKEIIETK